MEEIVYPYKPRAMLFLFVILFFGICSAVLLHEAMTNQRGVIIDRIIELNVMQATIFYWILSILSILSVCIGILVIVKGIYSKREIKLTQNAIISPKSGLSDKIVTVKYEQINKIDIFEVQHQKILRIFHDDGKLSIPNSMLPNKAVFEDLYAKLASKIIS